MSRAKVGEDAFLTGLLRVALVLVFEKNHVSLQRAMTQDSKLVQLVNQWRDVSPSHRQELFRIFLI